jgi:hypothetical protein
MSEVRMEKWVGGCEEKKSRTNPFVWALSTIEVLEIFQYSSPQHSKKMPK